MTSPSPQPRPGRAFLLYSSLRLLLFLVAYAVLLAAGVDQVVALGGAVLGSALLSVVLLRTQRQAFTDASMARAERKRAEKAARRAALDADQPPV